MNRFKVRGDTVDEKIKSIEKALQQISRRTSKTILGVIPPSLVFTFAQEPMESGLILSAALPSGRITKAFLVVKEYLENKQVRFTCKVSRPNGDYSSFIETRKHFEQFDLGIDIEGGDILDFSVGDSDSVQGIWISFLFEVAMDDSKIVQKIRDQLELIDGGDIES